MFESAELDHKVSKSVYKREESRLRERLLNAQYDLKDNGRFPVLLLIAGVGMTRFTKQAEPEAGAA